MKLMVSAVTSLLVVASIAAAQTQGEVVISVAGFELTANGADRSQGVSFLVDSSKIGQPAVGVFSVRDCGSWSLTVPPHSFAENAVAGWRIEVTPVRVVDHAVTFRLRWARALDRSSNLIEQDIEVTLKPGESRPVDSVPIHPDAKTFDGKPCTTTAASLRISADFPDLDRRLLGADLWLVERLPDGKERTQAQSVRGPFNRPIPFYFDSIVDGTQRLDFFGKLVADPIEGGFAIKLEAIRAAPNPDREWGYRSVRWFRSTLQLKPNEVVDIALPPLESKDAPFTDRTYSIRIKPRQIR